MKFTRHEIFKMEFLVVEKIDELQEFLNILQDARLESSQWIQELITDYEGIAKKLNVLYEQVVLDDFKIRD